MSGIGNKWFQPGSQTDHTMPWSVAAQLLYALTLIMTVVTDSIMAQEPPETVSQIREVRVSHKRLPQLLDHDWQPIPYIDYQALRKAAKPGPKTTWISEAVYSATFLDNSFQKGLLTAKVKHSGKHPELMLLHPLDLVVTELKWEQKNAVWGSTSGGKTALLVDGRGSRLQGRWLLKGRKLLRSVEFDFELAPATVSKLQLLIPDWFFLKSSAGSVSDPKPAEIAGWNLWQVELGSRTACHLTLSLQQQSTKTKPVILAETDTSYVISQDNLQFETKVNFETFEAPAEHLDFTIPEGVEIEEVLFDNETVLPVQIKGTGQARRLQVPLLDPTLGRSRRLRIRSSVPVEQSQHWTLPKLKLLNASIMQGELRLTVEAPLKLRFFQTHGLRQTETDSDAAQGETLTFHQFLPDARLTVDIGHPRLDLSSQIFTHLNLTTDNWSLKSEIEWNAVSGTTFETEYSISSDWEITGVQVRQKSSALISEANWNLKQDSDGFPLLEVEFPESLDPDHSKIVQILARRTIGNLDTGFSLPVITPGNCRVTKHWLAVTHPTRIIPELSSSSSSFKQVTRDEVPPDIRTSPHWEEISQTPIEQSMLFSFTALHRGGVMILNSQEPPVKSDVRVSVFLQQDLITENYSATIDPLSSPVSHVFVFITSLPNSPVPKKSLTWELSNGRNPPLRLKAQRIPRAQQRKQNLYIADNGDMWEIRLPSARTQPFEIRASRTRSPHSNFSPALLIVPGSKQFRGIVDLTALNELNIDVQSHGLTAVSPEKDQSLLSEFSSQKASSSRRLWSYHNASDQLNVVVHKEGFSRPAHRNASLKLQSLVFTGRGGNDIHQATFHLKEDIKACLFQFELPAPSSLTAVQMNGKPVDPLREGTSYKLPPIPANRPNIVIIQYRSPSSSYLIQELREIVVPKTSYNVLSFDWKFALHRETWLTGEPESLALLQPLSRISRGERFFGPLGGSIFFQAFDLKSMWKFFSQDRTPFSDSKEVSSESWAPVDWTIYRARAASLPEKLTLQFSSYPRSRLMSWISLLLSLVVGVVLRRLESQHREKLGLVWLSLCLVGAGLAPPVYALILGGGLTGTLFAMLLPKEIITKRLASTLSRKSEHLSSTATFRHIPATTLLILLGLLFAESSAQISFSQSSRNTAATTERQPPPTSPDEFTVLMPVKSNSDSAETPLVVYLRKQLLDHLRQADKDNIDRSDYLITSAEYHGHIDRRKLVTIDATFHIAVLSREPLTRVLLPMTDANPSGSDACQVNGRTQPVFQSPDGKGFVVELAMPKDGPVEAQKPTGSHASSDEASLRPRKPVTLFDVSLRLHPPTTTSMDGGRFRMGIPPITASRLTFELNNQHTAVQILGGRGGTVLDEGSNITKVELGRTDSFEVIFTSNDDPIEAPAKLEANVACLVEVHPTRLDFRFRIAYEVISGKVDYITWNLPPNIIVRKVESPQLLHRYKSPAKQAGSSLLLEFSTQQPKHFVVDATMTLPVQFSNNKISIPPIDLFEISPKQPVTTISTYQMGISTISGFQITPNRPRDGSITSIAPETFGVFPGSDGPSPSLGNPQFTYRLETPLEMELDFSPVKPQRKVRKIRQIGQVRKSKIDWTLTAELEVITPTSPAFQHRLIVDPRLIIDSIEVLEDNVDRLVRRTRNGTTVDLFLSEKTSGIQNITLKGNMPLVLSKETQLPLIRFAGSQFEDSNLLLYREPDILVEFPNINRMSLVKNADPEISEKGSDVFLARYQLAASDPPPSILPVLRNTLVAFDQVSILNRQPDSDWTLTTILRFLNASQRTTLFSIRIPATLTENFQILSSPDEHSRKALSDGSIEMTFENPQSKFGILTVVLKSSLTAPPSGDWQLPTVSTVDAERNHHFLVLSLENNFAPAGDESHTKLKSDVLPPWIRKTISLHTEKTSTLKVYQSVSQVWNLVKQSAEIPKMEAHVPLIQTWVSLDQLNREFGYTEIFFLSGTQRLLELAWPDNLKLRALSVNGTLISSQAVTENRLIAPVNSASRVHHIQVFWSGGGNGASSLFRSLTPNYPMPKNVHVGRSLMTLIPSSKTLLFATGGFTQLDAGQHTLERLEGLLEAAREDYETGSSRAEIWASLDHFHRSYKRSFEETEIYKPTTELSVHSERFDRINNEIESLNPTSEQPIEQPYSQDNRLNLFDYTMNKTTDQAANREQFFGLLPVDDASGPMKIWIVKNSLVQWSMAAVGFLLALLILRKVCTLQTGDWLNEHQPVAWMLMGLFWWLCLKPSGIGLGMLLVAILMGVRQFQHRQPKTVEQPVG
jgi:hypothetical protein